MSETPDDWWPTPLAHLAREDPWAAELVVVAELLSFDEKPYAGHRTSFCALVPVGEVDAVRTNLARFDHDVRASGPRPDPSPGEAYVPKFWIDAVDLPSRRYEPLVLSWSGHDKTVLTLEPGFLMTYGLSSRHLSGGVTAWDDPAIPRADVALVGPPSTWSYPLGTASSVKILKTYLQDYLSLRHAALVQVYSEQRYAKADGNIDAALGDAEAIEKRYPDRTVWVHRIMGGRGEVSVEVSGARILAVPGAFPVSDDPLDTQGLTWPGFAEPVTNGIARRLGMEWAYVDDGVLAEFEGRPGYRISPMHGSVTFGTQWSVGYCDRLGRNLIQLELKKLYEGAPPHIIHHWNRFAVPPPARSAYPSLREAQHVGKRARDLVYAMTALGEALEELDAHLGGGGRTPEEFVRLRRSTLEYQGWWTFPQTAPLAWHIPPMMPLEALLSRAEKLDQLLIEGLNEAALRSLATSAGAPKEIVSPPGRPLRGLKLLNIIVCLSQVSAKTGLDLRDHGGACWQILQEDGTEPTQPIARLFALHEARTLSAHSASDKGAKLMRELEPFGIAPGDEGGGYGLLLDRIYDGLIVELEAAKVAIRGAVIRP